MTNKPNIIFYFSDQQRWDTMGCYGQKLPVTPNLDRLAREGTLFCNAITCQPVCGPARACLQSGKYATEVGCHRNGLPLPRDKGKLLAEYFHDAGYETAYVGKWHLASHDDEENYWTSPVPLERRGGYQDYWMAADTLEFTSHGYNGYVFDRDGKKVEFTGYRPDCINNYAIDYLHGHDASKPFFLFVSQLDPHHQNDRRIFEGPDGSKERFRDYVVPGDLAGQGGDWRENYPDYLGQCNSLDYNVGRLIDTLKEKKLWDNTILFYTADHGSHFRTRNEEYKRSCHEGCVHIPMIAYGGGFTGGGAREELVSLIDIPVTLLDCAGIPKPTDFRGDSLLRLVNGQVENWKDHVFIQISESHIGRAVRTAKWKYEITAPGDANESGAAVYRETFLYDLENDPDEQNNLVASPELASVRQMLAEMLTEEMVRVGEAAPVIEVCA